MRHMDIKSLISPARAFLMTSLLKSVVENGTAGRLKNMGITYPVAGKTGTTNDCKDAWFVGYTPDVLALVWVGFDNGDAVDATGASAAMPIWADLMKNIPQYVSGEDFNMPPGIVKCAICSQSGLLAGEGHCPDIMTEFFLEENAPGQRCPLHDETESLPPGGLRSKPVPRESRPPFFKRINNFDK